MPPRDYTDDEIIAMLDVADEEEWVILSSFLCSGFRSGELANFTYADINFATNIWRVEMKEEGESAEWDAKTQVSYRHVTVPAWLNQKIEQSMKARRARRSDLVFPAPMGGIDSHLLRIVKRVANRAGLTDIRVDDHKYCSTAITRWLQEGNSVPDVMAWVGHKSPTTILRYGAKVNSKSPRHQVTPPTSNSRAGWQHRANYLPFDNTSSPKQAQQVAFHQLKLVFTD